MRNQYENKRVKTERHNTRGIVRSSLSVNYLVYSELFRIHNKNHSLFVYVWSFLFFFTAHPRPKISISKPYQISIITVTTRSLIFFKKIYTVSFPEEYPLYSSYDYFSIYQYIKRQING